MYLSLDIYRSYKFIDGNILITYVLVLYNTRSLRNKNKNLKMGLKGLSKSPSYLLNTKTVLVGLMLQPYDCTHLTNGYFFKKMNIHFYFQVKITRSKLLQQQCSYTSRKKCSIDIYSGKLELNRLQNYSSDCSEKICNVRNAFK